MGIAAQHTLVGPLLAGHRERGRGQIDAKVELAPKEQIRNRAVPAAKIHDRWGEQMDERLNIEELVRPKQGKKVDWKVGFQQESEIVCLRSALAIQMPTPVL